MYGLSHDHWKVIQLLDTNIWKVKNPSFGFDWDRKPCYVNRNQERQTLDSKTTTCFLLSCTVKLSTLTCLYSRNPFTPRLPYFTNKTSPLILKPGFNSRRDFLDPIRSFELVWRCVWASTLFDERFLSSVILNYSIFHPQGGREGAHLLNGAVSSMLNFLISQWSDQFFSQFCEHLRCNRVGFFQYMHFSHLSRIHPLRYFVTQSRYSIHLPNPLNQPLDKINCGGVMVERASKSVWIPK